MFWYHCKSNKVIFYGARNRRRGIWSFLQCASQIRGSEAGLLWTIQAWDHDSRKFRGRFWVPSILSLRAKLTPLMKKMGYDLAKSSNLNFGNGKRALLWSFVPKGKIFDYYHKTWRGLGYVSILVPSNSESKEFSCHDHLSCNTRIGKLWAKIFSLD